MKIKPSQFISNFKVFFFLLCLGISLVQIYYEVGNFLENKIFTSSNIDNVDNAPIHLVFCDSFPLEDRVISLLNKNLHTHTIVYLQTLSLDELKERIIKPMLGPTGDKLSGSIMYTLYHGTCIKYEMDLQKMIGGKYLYSDWGKRFCIHESKSILMFAFFPGEGVQLSTIDPSFTLKDTALVPSGWFDVMLEMKIANKLQKENFECQKNDYKSVLELKGIHLEHESCLLENFIENWKNATKNWDRPCYPSFLKNSNLLYDKV